MIARLMHATESPTEIGDACQVCGAWHEGMEREPITAKNSDGGSLSVMACGRCRTRLGRTHDA